VPDGGLHYFPFTALTSVPGKDAGPQEIVKVPSASVIDIVRRTKDASRPAYALVVFADAVYDALDSRVRGLNGAKSTGSSLSGVNRSVAHGGDSLFRLRHTLTEARAISQLFPANQFRRFLDFGATREAAAGNALRDFRVIHLATHSLT